MANANANPWEDLTEDVIVAGRQFRLREMTRHEVDKLTDLYVAGVEDIKKRAAKLGEAGSTADLVKDALALQWDTQAPALQFILREPLDGGEAPTLEWICANLNERRTLLLIGTQERLNGTEKFKKKLEKLGATPLLQSRAGSFLTTELPTDTDSGQAKSELDSPTEKLDS